MRLTFDSRDRRPIDSEANFVLEINEPIINPVAVRLTQCEFANSLYTSIKDEYLSITFPYIGAENLAVFEPGIITTANLGETDLYNFGLSFNIRQEGISIAYFKLFRDPETLKMSAYCNRSCTLSCQFKALSNLLGLNRNEPLQLSPIVLEGPQRPATAAERYLEVAGIPVTPAHPEYGVDFTGRMQSIALGYAVEFPKIIDMNSDQYLFLVCEELRPFASKLRRGAKSMCNYGLARIQMSQDVGKFVYINQETEEWIPIEERLVLTSLRLRIVDRDGDDVSLNGLPWSGELQFLV